MKLTTRHFGDIEVDEDKIISFDEGLPGFINDRTFVLLSSDENDVEGDNLFCWLQSINNGNTAFALMNVFNVLPEYNPLVNENEVSSLGDMSGNELLIYNIVVIPDEIEKMRVNLKAPIVINPVTKRGKQVIATNEEYNVRHYIFEEVKNRCV